MGAGVCYLYAGQIQPPLSGSIQVDNGKAHINEPNRQAKGRKA